MEECSFYDIFCWLSWLVTEIKQMFVGLYSAILSSVTDLVSSIPAPDFLTGTMPTIPASVLYFADLFMVPHGLLVIVSAYLLRFLIRRIPFIG
jgi:hypothetical protein